MTPSTIVVLLAVALAYHGVAFALNDIIDLPIDRTNPGRAHATLVSGRATVSLAWIIVFAFAVLSFAFDLLKFGYETVSLLYLTAGYLGLVGYDLLTKRTRWPILHDVLLALGCAALLFYAADRGGGVTGPTLLAACYVALFVVLVNGVHGGLRDLGNDAQHAGVTTAFALGARIDEGAGMVLPRRLIAYAWTLNCAMVAVAVAAALIAPSNGPGHVILTFATSASTLVGLLALAYGLRQHRNPHQFRRAGLIHMLTSYSPVVFITTLNGGWLLGVAVVIVMLAPLPANPRFRASWRASGLKAWYRMTAR